MTRILIAADESTVSIEAARKAHHLFGDDAEYFVVNVDQSSDSGLAWGYAYPVAMPMPYPVPPMTTGPTTEPGQVAGSVDRAERRAGQLADQASLIEAEPIGDVGDPATAIIEAAETYDVDVIVVGSHDRSWFSRLFAGSVSGTVVRDAHVPVLVVK
jgi:nucleotide-binding universal stress UspA family protein